MNTFFLKKSTKKELKRQLEEKIYLGKVIWKLWKEKKDSTLPLTIFFFFPQGKKTFSDLVA